MSVMTPLNTGRVVLCLPVVGMFLWEVITCEGFVLFQFEFVYSFSVYLNILIFFASHGFCKYIAYLWVFDIKHDLRKISSVISF